MKKNLAVVTMAYNESKNLQRWLRHYEKQASSMDDLYVVDHGSTDGSTTGLPCQVTTLPRSAGGDRLQAWRADYIADFCSNLLAEYTAVLYTDADELVVAEPSRFQTLSQYVVEGGKCNATIGYDVLHDFEAEPALTDNLVLLQRERLLFVAAMCKPSLIKAPTRFSAGFHNSSERPVFGDLYRFHLRYADLQQGLQRLSVTRSLDRPEMKGVPIDHQQIEDQTYKGWLNSWLSYPVFDDELGLENADVKHFLSNLNVEIAPNGIYNFRYDFRATRLVRVPPNFRGSA